MIEQLVVKESIFNLKELQIKYEHMFDKKQTRKLIRDRFSEVLEPDEVNLDLKTDILGITALRNSKTSVSAIIEILVNRLNVEESTEKVIQSIVELIQKDLLTYSYDNRDRLYVEGKFTLEDSDLDLIDQYQYKIPLLVKPLPLNQKGNNKGNGYYLNGSESLILNTYHTYDIDHKVLERFNNIPYCINLSLMKNIRNMWKKMDKEETIKNFERFEKGVFDISSILLNNGNKFYFTHKYDKRGRIYSCGYHLNIQGNAYAKAQLELANKQLISEDINFF